MPFQAGSRTFRRKAALCDSCCERTFERHFRHNPAQRCRLIEWGVLGHYFFLWALTNPDQWHMMELKVRKGQTGSAKEAGPFRHSRIRNT